MLEVNILVIWVLCIVPRVELYCFAKSEIISLKNSRPSMTFHIVAQTLGVEQGQVFSSASVSSLYHHHHIGMYSL